RARAGRRRGLRWAGGRAPGARQRRGARAGGAPVRGAAAGRSLDQRVRAAGDDGCHSGRRDRRRGAGRPPRGRGPRAGRAGGVRMTFAETVLSVTMLAQTVRIAVPYACAALGGVWSERSGVVNIALEGTLLVTGLTAVAVHVTTGSAILGALGACAAGGLFA